MSVPGASSSVDIEAKHPSLMSSAAVLLRLTWVRTASPMLVVAIVALVLLPMAFAVIFASRGPMSGDAVQFLVQRYDQLVLALATPLIALLLGTSAFTAEAEDGTLLYLVTTTTPRWWIAIVRVLFAATLTGVLSALAILGTGYPVHGPYDQDGVTRAFAVAVCYGGAVYAACFTALALITKRALVVGLGYVLFWEGILSATFPGIDYLSVRQWMLAVASSLTDVIDPRLNAGPSAKVAIVGGAILVLSAVTLSARRLREPRTGRI